MKAHRLHTCFVLAAAIASAVLGQSCWAAPVLSPTTAGGTATSASISVGTSTFTLGLHFDSSGNRVADLTYYLATTPANAVKYASITPVVVSAASAGNLNAFTNADLVAGQAPAAGSTVAGGGAGMTVFFDAGNGDYAPFAAEIAQYTVNTSGLAANTTYVFTPVGFELVNVANAASPIESDGFATPGTFTLTVTPEPASLTVIGIGIVAAGAHRRRAFAR